MQMTWLFLFFGFIPGILFYLNKYLWAVITLQIWYILDGVDGEIARYEKEESLTGVFFDSAVHYIIHPYIFICIGIGLLRRTDDIFYFILSLSAALSVIMISASSDLKDYVIAEMEVKRPTGSSERIFEAKKSTLSLAKWIFVLLHKASTFPTIMNVITVAVLLRYFFRIYAFKELIIFYGLLSPLVWISKIFVNIKNKTIDASA